MLLNYPNFYRHYGIRQMSQIAEPALVDLKLLELPSLSVYHYVSYDGTETGPVSSNYLFRNITHPILLGHVTELVETKGAPRLSSGELPTFISDYHRQHRRMRRIKGIETIERDTASLVVYNYCLINKIYRYTRSMFTEYFKWYNLFSTLIANVAAVTEHVERQHFLFAKIPKVIPSVDQLNRASEEVTASLLNTFRGEDSFLLLELWKWLGTSRANSIFARIPANKIHLVNVVYQEGARWTVVNLGKLNAFRADKSDPDAQTYVLRPDSQPLDPLQIQKRLLRMMMTLMEVRTLTANVAEVDPTPAPVAPAKPSSMAARLTGEDDNDTEEEHTSSEEQGDQGFTELDAPVIPTLVDADARDMDIGQSAQASSDEEEDAHIKKERIRAEDERLDQDLLQLNEIAQRQEAQVTSAEAPLEEVIYQSNDDDLEQGVLGVCDRLADDGLLSAAEYKRFSKLAGLFKTLPAPEGKGFLGDFIAIPPETLKITQTAKVPDSLSILDKSMLGSSLLAFDERYITDVMARDTAGMVLNMQKAGVAVTGYSVEKVHDILGGFEMHRVRLTPVVGQQSTLHFKLPLLKPDGTYTSNGVKYRLRKQRGDLPIRKTTPARVALTSYYGKGFINRGKKKANDYGHWLQCQVTLKAMDKSDMSITAYVADNVFRPQENAPRAFSAIAGVAKSLQARGFTLFFDLADTVQNFDPVSLGTWAVRGNILIGKNPAGDLLVMDPHGTVYTAHQKTLTPFGSLESFLNIPVQNAPVESAGMVVFGKEIPVGVILAYYLGFEKLLRLLKVTPRRVAAGARLNLQAHEYALAFSDESLVFSREDRFAAMVLGGFNDYHRAIKLFSVYSFDKRGVYLNLLEANGLGTRFVRELDLMRSMFIDPITKDLLVEMKEPTTFQGLLLRSCELLLSDNTPEELDPAYMRIKGYERMSGAVYSEIIQSLRAHNSRLGKSNAPIEMNPYAVWKRISEDPAKSQVGEINPIKSIKEVEAVTYAGTGGRNKQSMVKSSRAYHLNDMGTISESTTDSSDVGINIFMCADPQFTSLRGISKRYDMANKPTASLLSTSALLAPGSDRDDPKRVKMDC